MSVELDIGPLSWVKGEIDLALERAGECLTAYAADTAGDGLSKARASMHQAHGALAIVGLEGITEFADAIEQLLAAIGDGSAKDATVPPSPPRNRVSARCAPTSTTSWPATRISR
jgi:chemosensory pili system protein ChpA (sensor histidine kinase/response regulator)